MRRRLKAAALAAALLMMCSNSGCLVYNLYNTTTTVEPVETLPSETLDTHFLDLSREDQFLTVVAQGDFFYDLTLSNAGSHVMHNSVVGGYGYPLEVSMNTEQSGKFRLDFLYDTASLGDIPEENLMLLYYSEEEEAYYDPVTDAVQDMETDTISVDTPAPGVYALVDSYVWLSAWGEDVPELAHDSTFTSDDFGFTFTVPKEICYTYCSDYLKDMPDGTREQEFIYIYGNDENPLRLEARYKEIDIDYDTNLQGLVDYFSDNDYGFRILSYEPKKMPNGLRADFLELEYPGLDGETQYQYAGYYQISDIAYIYLCYNYTDPAYRETAENSLYSFRFQ